MGNDRQQQGVSRRLATALAGGALALGITLVPQAALANQPMYRLYNHYNGDHMYTLNASERDDLVKLGWDDEGIAWQVPEKGDSVWRLYNPYSGEHLFTLDRAEYDHLVALGWTGEGEGFKSGDETGAPIYRLYNRWLTAGTHLYTTNKTEYDALATIGWSGESVAFRAASEESGDAGKTTGEDAGKDAGKDTGDEDQDATITLDGTIRIVHKSQLLEILGIKDADDTSDDGLFAVLELDRSREVTLPNGEVTTTHTVKYVLLPGSFTKEYEDGQHVSLSFDLADLEWSSARDLGISIDLPDLPSISDLLGQLVVVSE